MPRSSTLDATIALRLDPYGFISKECDRLGSDLFLTRLNLQKTICLRGPAAAAVFYDARYFVRARALPKRVLKTLVGEGGVQTLDGEVHRHRKAMVLTALGPARVQALVEIVGREWRAAAASWAGKRIVLYEEMKSTLTRAACAWAGLPLDDPDRRTKQIAQLFQHAGDMGPLHFAARHARKETESWAASLIQEVRRGRSTPAPESALAAIAHHRDLSGAHLPPRVAAVELLNVLRPTVALSVFTTFVAHALHEHPQMRSRVMEEPYLTWFVQEVRRFYPFFPATVARVREDFEWNGFRLPGGTRAMLDLYGTDHDPRTWTDPDVFRPERFQDRAPTPYDLIAQGAGDMAQGHRCAGEPATLEVLREATRFLAGLAYDVPEQDLEIDRRQVPALPRTGFIIEVRA